MHLVDLVVLGAIFLCQYTTLKKMKGRGKGMKKERMCGQLVHSIFGDMSAWLLDVGALRPNTFSPSVETSFRFDRKHALPDIVCCSSPSPSLCVQLMVIAKKHKQRN
jgi:hypothetical protein